MHVSSPTADHAALQRVRPSSTPWLRGFASVSATAILLLVTAACARTPPEPPAPAVLQLAGSYTGNITVDGDFLPARMTVTQNGAALTLEFQIAELGVATRGEGVAQAERFTGRVPYQLACPGEAELEGRVEEDGRVLTGTLQATDCDGTTNGTFRFTRPSS